MNRRNKKHLYFSIVLLLALVTLFVLMFRSKPRESNALRAKFSNTTATVASTESTEWTGATIPNYLGKTYDEAVEAAKKDSSIKIMRNYTDNYSDEFKEGTVMSQNPPAGTKVTTADSQEGVIISLTISKGAQMRELPDIEGLTIEQASEDIAKQGLLGSAEYQYSDKYAEGRVIGYKDKNKGETVEYGTSITIIVSKGKEPVATEEE